MGTAEKIGYMEKVHVICHKTEGYDGIPPKFPMQNPLKGPHGQYNSYCFD